MQEPVQVVTSGRELKARQEDPAQLGLLLALRRVGRQSKRARLLRVGVSLGIALAGPLLTTLHLLSYDIVGSIAGVWVLVGLVLGYLERPLVDQAARLSEEFDCAVFGLPWETAHGRPAQRERLSDLSKGVEQGVARERLHGWYVVDDEVPGVLAVLVCQRKLAFTAGGCTPPTSGSSGQVRCSRSPRCSCS